MLGALPGTRLLMVLLNLSCVGAASSLSMDGRLSMLSRLEVTTLLLAGVKLSLVFYPSLPLFVHVCHHFPTGWSNRCSFTLGGTKGFLDAIVHSSDVACFSYYVDVFTELLAICIGTAFGCLLKWTPVEASHLGNTCALQGQHVLLESQVFTSFDLASNQS